MKYTEGELLKNGGFNRVFRAESVLKEKNAFLCLKAGWSWFLKFIKKWY